MLLWWLTLCTTFKPLLNMVTRLMYAAAFLYLGQEQQQHTQQTQLRQPRNDNIPANFVRLEEKTSPASEPDFSTFAVNATMSPLPSSAPTETVASTVKASSPSFITGVFNYDSSVNFNNYLKELGVPYLLRTFAGLASPVVSISKSCPKNDANDDDADCQWKIRTDTLFKSHELNFRLGAWGSDVTMDGRSVRYKVEREGPNRLVEVQESGQTRTKLVRDFSRDRMVVTLTVNDVVSTSLFLREFYAGAAGGEGDFAELPGRRRK